MSRVTITGLSKHFDGKPPSIAVGNLHLDVEEGEFVALLGPSGCGKTTTLRCVAGLERPGEGKISIGNTTVFDSAARVNVPPDKRRIGMVFQSYALWPHMTVKKNIAYPLKVRGMKSALKDGWVEQTARMVECDTLLSRYPMQLSGGQQQRVALARALVARPDVILFDEPLSNLDARLRDQMRTEIHELHQRTPFTAIFVTHDQTEALALGQRIAIMRAGSIEQLDTPEQVYEHPATEYVASFIGLSNRLVCDLTDGVWSVGGDRLNGAPLDPGWRGRAAVRFGPDHARLVRDAGELAAGEASVAARTADVEFGGTHMNVTLQVGDTRARARMLCGGQDSWIRHLAPGDAVQLAFHPALAAVYQTSEQAESVAVDPAMPEVAGV
jgi:iron(III) transport system ATP-binding protein